MSWNNGSQETPRLSRPDPKHARIVAELSRRLPWVIITPRGAAVEPDVYWRKARSSRPARGSDQRSDSPRATASVARRGRPARAGTPEAQRSESGRRAEVERIAAGRALSAIDPSRGAGRFGR